MEGCKHFNVELDERNYHAEWFNGIEGPLTDRVSFSDIRQAIVEQQDMCLKEGEQASFQHLIDIIDWLDANFTVVVNSINRF